MNVKLRSNVLALALGGLAALTAATNPVQARETNEVNHAEKKKIFVFEGGNPIDFVVALDRHFRTRLVQILTLPEKLSRTQVPKLRVAANDPREVLTVYNRLESPTLGQWRFEPESAAQNPPATNLNVLMLEPDKTAADGRMERAVTKVKGVALAGVPQPKWEALTRDINDARSHGEEATKGVGDVLEGSFRFQRESKVLIVSGSEAYIEMVESLVAAHRMNAEIEAKAAVSSAKATAEAPAKQ
ncbi:MAG TPA: hypothetical protein VJW76_06800 [Verrucomicrobiae bacterium]|nr:hypothetical protein [Verrucomicrobiae bacterium]